MDKLEMAKLIIEQAIEEKRRLAKVEAELEALRKKRDNGGVSDYWSK